MRYVIIIAVVLILTACLKLPVETPTPESGVIMYTCGIDRCRGSSTYGELILPAGINVWEHPAPNRGKILRSLSHNQKVSVVEERKIHSRPGGTWYRLWNGGWLDDYFVTTLPCEPNLEEYTYPSCD